MYKDYEEDKVYDTAVQSYILYKLSKLIIMHSTKYT